MSTRTIIEINHDYLDANTLEALINLWHSLPTEQVPRVLNETEGRPAYWKGGGLRVLAQRHHSENLLLRVE